MSSNYSAVAIENVVDPDVTKSTLRPTIGRQTFPLAHFTLRIHKVHNCLLSGLPFRNHKSAARMLASTLPRALENAA